jgi:polyferredoxin
VFLFCLCLPFYCAFSLGLAPVRVLNARSLSLFSVFSLSLSLSLCFAVMFYPESYCFTISPVVMFFSPFKEKNSNKIESQETRKKKRKKKKTNA